MLHVESLTSLETKQSYQEAIFLQFQGSCVVFFFILKFVRYRVH